MKETVRSLWLKERGWRLIGTGERLTPYIARVSHRGSDPFWDHLLHQPLRNGAFTTAQAVAHQKKYEKDRGCDCVKGEEEDQSAFWRDVTDSSETLFYTHKENCPCITDTVPHAANCTYCSCR